MSWEGERGGREGEKGGREGGREGGRGGRERYKSHILTIQYSFYQYLSWYHFQH